MVKVPEGELKAPEIRRLIKKHNELMSIKIPKGTDRDGLLNLIKNNGYKVDHKAKKLVPLTSMKRKPTVKLPPPPPKKTADEKMKAKKERMKKKEMAEEKAYNTRKAKIDAVKKIRDKKKTKDKSKSKEMGTQTDPQKAEPKKAEPKKEEEVKYLTDEEWNEIKKWSKDNGFSVSKGKNDRGSFITIKMRSKDDSGSWTKKDVDVVKTFIKDNAKKYRLEAVRAHKHDRFGSAFDGGAYYKIWGMDSGFVNNHWFKIERPS